MTTKVAAMQDSFVSSCQMSILVVDLVEGPRWLKRMNNCR